MNTTDVTYFFSILKQSPACQWVMITFNTYLTPLLTHRRPCTSDLFMWNKSLEMFGNFRNKQLTSSQYLLKFFSHFGWKIKRKILTLMIDVRTMLDLKSGYTIMV